MGAGLSAFEETAVQCAAKRLADNSKAIRRDCKDAWQQRGDNSKTYTPISGQGNHQENRDSRELEGNRQGEHISNGAYNRR